MPDGIILCFSFVSSGVRLAGTNSRRVARGAPPGRPGRTRGAAGRPPRGPRGAARNRGRWGRGGRPAARPAARRGASVRAGVPPGRAATGRSAADAGQRAPPADRHRDTVSCRATGRLPEGHRHRGRSPAYPLARAAVDGRPHVAWRRTPVWAAGAPTPHGHTPRHRPSLTKAPLLLIPPPSGANTLCLPLSLCGTPEARPGRQALGNRLCNMAAPCPPSTRPTAGAPWRRRCHRRRGGGGVDGGSPSTRPAQPKVEVKKTSPKC